MRKIILSISILLVISACSQNSKKEETNTFKKGVVKIITTYPNITYSTSLNYNEQNLIVGIVRLNNDYEELNVVCNYNNSIKPNKFEYYYEGVLSTFATAQVLNDSLIVSNFTISEGETIENTHDLYVYNKNSEIEQIVRYKRDNMGVWKIGGSKYEYQWENGNIVNLKCYIPTGFSPHDTTLSKSKIRGCIQLKLPKISDELAETGYTLYYESSYTYDDKNNPYNNTSISYLIMINNHNVSSNNPTSIEKKYTEGEKMSFKFTYKYNELGYPTMSDINLTTNMEDLEKVHYTREFIY